MRYFASTLAALLLAASAGPALAHGGQYRGPGGRAPRDPTVGPVKPVTSTADWEAWWSANAWKYLNLRERLRERDRGRGTASGGGLGVIAGPAPEVRGDALDPRGFLESRVLPVVTRGLQDADAEVRSAATIALGKMGFPRSLVDLRKVRGDTARDVRDGAILAMGMIGDSLALEELRAILHDPKEDERTRSFAALAMGFVGGDEAGEALLGFLAPEADAEREGGLRRTAYSEASAIVALGFTGWKGAVEPLRKDYASGTRFEPAVRSFVAITLARLGDREAIPFLLQGLAHNREPMRQSAAIALGVLGTPDDAEVVKALARKTLDDADVNTRQFSIMSLARIGGDDSKAALRKLLERAGPMELPFVALGLAVAEDRPSVPLLRKRFADERNPDLKGAYALALGLFRDRDSAGEIRRLAVNRVDPSLRGNCLTALGLMEDRESAEPVRAMMQEERDPAIRLKAALCLGLLQDPSTVSLLEELVREGTNSVLRSNACQLLGAVGNPRSAEVLIALVEDPKELSVVRMSAMGGLGTLGDPSLIPLLSQIAIDSNYAVFVDPLREVSMIM